MIGKSYDGTLSNGVAATGVEGLKTIVPVSAISAWYNYSRTGGVRHNTNYPGGSLNPRHHLRAARARRPASASPSRRTDLRAGQQRHQQRRQRSTPATVTRTATSTRSGATATTTSTPHEDQGRRCSPRTACRTTTSRWTTIGMWWDTLGKAGVERKLWLLRAGHEDPFDSRRAVWVDTLHRWFDHYLYGVNNGIENEKARHGRGRAPTSGRTTRPGRSTARRTSTSSCARPTTPTAPGTLGGRLAAARRTRSATPSQQQHQRERPLMNTPTGAQTNRRVFLSRTLTKDVRLSGTARLRGPRGLARRARRATSASLIADYGTGTQVIAHNSEGVSTPRPRTCWGDSGSTRAAGRPPAPSATSCTVDGRADRQRLLPRHDQADSRPSPSGASRAAS